MSAAGRTSLLTQTPLGFEGRLLPDDRRHSSGFVVYGLLKATLGLRLSPEAEFDGADLSIHKISATPEREASW